MYVLWRLQAQACAKSYGSLASAICDAAMPYA